MIKVQEILGIKGIYPSIIKAVYSKPIANKRNSKQLHENREENKAVYFLHIYSIYSKVLIRTIRQLTEGHQGDTDWKERSQDIIISR